MDGASRGGERWIFLFVDPATECEALYQGDGTFSTSTTPTCEEKIALQQAASDPGRNTCEQL
jgi:hypothetical protein